MILIYYFAIQKKIISYLIKKKPKTLNRLIQLYFFFLLSAPSILWERSPDSTCTSSLLRNTTQNKTARKIPFVHHTLLPWKGCGLQKKGMSLCLAASSTIHRIYFIKTLWCKAFSEYTVNPSLLPFSPPPLPAEVSSISLLDDVSKVTWVLFSPSTAS